MYQHKSRAVLIYSAIAISAILLCCQSCTKLGLSHLSADAIHSRVIDADTGKPLEGVVVVAYWELNKGSLIGDSLPCGSANVKEAVTDGHGDFQIGGWGPIKNPCGGVMEGYEPMLYLFKPGYNYRKVVTNGVNNHRAVNHTNNIWWGNHSIKMTRIKNMNYSMSGKYYASFDVFNSELELFIIDMPRQCNWRKIPKTLHLLEIERQKFTVNGEEVSGITSTLEYNDQGFLKEAPQCGSPEYFLERLLK